MLWSHPNRIDVLVQNDDVRREVANDLLQATDLLGPGRTYRVTLGAPYSQRMAMRGLPNRKSDGARPNFLTPNPYEALAMEDAVPPHEDGVAKYSWPLRVATLNIDGWGDTGFATAKALAKRRLDIVGIQETYQRAEVQAPQVEGMTWFGRTLAAGERRGATNSNLTNHGVGVYLRTDLVRASEVHVPKFMDSIWIKLRPKTVKRKHDFGGYKGHTEVVLPHVWVCVLYLSPLP